MLITLIAIPTLCIGGCTACVLAVSMRSPNPGTFQPDHQQASSISSSNQATPKPKARKYVAEMSVEMHQSPESEAKVIGKIKEGTHLEAIAKDHHWIKVNFKGKEGWVASTLLTRVMDVPAPDLEFYSNGYKVIDRKYRYFFGISNSGLKPYKGQLTLRLLDENGVVFEEVYTFSENPILGLTNATDIIPSFKSENTISSLIIMV